MKTIQRHRSAAINQILWDRAARKECVQYREHGIDIEDRDGRTVCFNCGGDC